MNKNMTWYSKGDTVNAVHQTIDAEAFFFFIADSYSMF